MWKGWDVGKWKPKGFKIETKNLNNWITNCKKNKIKEREGTFVKAFKCQKS